MLKLRPANDSDRAIVMAWRSNPLIYQGFYTQKEPLRWQDHCQWWESRNDDWYEFIIELEQDSSRPVGVVTIGQMDHWSPELGYFIGEVTLWGNGVGKKAVEKAMEWLKEQGKTHCHTTIKDDNERSIHLVTSLGFIKLGAAREGESWYQKKL